MRKKKIGLLGGSFDPIHFGHLLMAEEARVQVALDEVIFIPAGVPPHKLGKRRLSSPAHRLKMTSLAIEGNNSFGMSDFEILQRGGPTFTIDTLKHFHSFYSDAELFFIMGMDSFVELHTWKDCEHLTNYSRLIVATRPGYDSFRDEMEKAKEKGVIFIEIPPLATSSTDLRKRYALGRPIRYLVPESVWQYVQQNQLYV